MKKPSSGLIGTLCFIIVAAICIPIAVAVENTHEHSTKGVVTINDYEAAIAKGDRLILTSSSGKQTTYWSVTFDGDNAVYVHQDTSFFPADYSGSLCGIGCSKELDMGWLRHVTITARANHRVSVHWEWGWGYRRYQNNQD